MKRIGILIFVIALSQSLFSQETIIGIVKNQKGDPLIGANVLLKNSKKLPKIFFEYIIIF